MPSPIVDLPTLLRSLEPVRNPGVFAFVSVPEPSSLASTDPIATIREPEGLSAILPESEALRRGLPVLFRASWITLTVASDLQAVGLTAAVAAALGEAGIACNVVAGAWHDHLFVPVDRAGEALEVLRRLQREVD